MSAAGPETWNLQGLVDQFLYIDRKVHNRRFAFILGAGASVQSGIPAAGALVQRWLTELHRRLAPGGVPLDRWATAEALEITGFSYAQAASFYGQVFARRFRQHPDEGYADLEDIMRGKDPSFGYSVLAHILAETRHKLVITTNFDNLVHDALSIFTGTTPLVCGHESLANFVHVEPRRPLVVKIHRDLLMAPMNHAAEIAALQSAWVEPLTKVFKTYTPIVLGYGGNDGSLMGFLNGLPEGTIPGGIFWCYYGPGGPPAPEIRRLVARHGGVLVPIEGFDELMLQLSAPLGIPLLDHVIETKARTRVDNYRRRVEELQASVDRRPASEAAAGGPGSAVPAAVTSEAPPTAQAEARPPPLPSVPSASPRQSLGPSRGLESVRSRPPLPVSSSMSPPAPPVTPGGLLGTSDREAVGPTRSGSASVPRPARRGPTRDADGSTLSEETDDFTPSFTTDRPERRKLEPTASAGVHRDEPQVERASEESFARLDSLASEADDDAEAEEAPPPPRANADEAPPRGWTTGPLVSLSAAGESLQRALQQVTRNAAPTGPWSVWIQARAEPDRERARALLRAGLERFPDDQELLLGLAARLAEVPDD